MAEEITAADLCHNNFIKADANETVSQVAGRFIEKKQNHALVFEENNAYLGVTTKEGFWQKHADFTKLKLKSLVKGKPVLYSDDSLQTIAELMFSSEARILPVFENRKLLGVVSARDVVLQLEKNSDVTSKKAQEIASPALVVGENDSVEHAISIVRNKKINRIPLVSKNGELTGLFSFSDFLQNLARIAPHRPKGRSQKGKENSKALRVLDMAVKDFSSVDPQTVRFDESLATVLKKMREKNISSLIVTQQSRPIGIITIRDLLKLLIKKTKAVSNVQLQLSNRPELDEVDSAALDKKISDFTERFSKKFASDFLLAIHFKKESKTGIRKKYSVKAHLTAAGVDLAAKAEEWNVITATQEALRALEAEAKRKKR